MSLNPNKVQTTYGDFTLTCEMCCDGLTSIEKNNKELDTSDCFDEIKNLSEELLASQKEVVTVKRTYNQLFDEMLKEQEKNRELGEQLASANARVKELQGFYATYEREFRAVTKWAISMQNNICEGKYYNNTPEGMIYSESAWVDCRWQDVTDPLFTSHAEALNKFALEQKEQELVELKASLGCLDNKDASKFAFAINKRIEQLRKEKDNGGL